MNWHSIKLEQAFKALKTDKNGLTTKEAENRLLCGKNILVQKKRTSPLRKFLSQFNDFMVIVLIIAAIVSLLVSFYQGEGDYIDSIIIMVIVFLNALLGFIQENKAEKAMEALKKLSSPKAVVLRDGLWKEIDTENLVSGDIIKLECGDFIPADGRLIESKAFKTDEAYLTGESDNILKDCSVISEENAPLGERMNMVFSGSTVTSGRGIAIVCETGMSTQIGSIAKMIMTEKNEMTPLQLKLEETGKILGIGAMAICFIIFILGIFRHIPIFEMFMTSVSLAVAAIPEGLPAIVTIMLALGVERMAKKNAIIRKLPAVEALGSATVICSDKTGTLTQNRMKVMEITDGRKEKILSLMCLCNNAQINSNKGNITGEPTEVALLSSAEENGIHKAEEEKKYKRIDEIPFDSKRKLMSTIHKTKNNYLIITKGAYEVLLDKCISYEDKNGEIKELTTYKKNQLKKNAEKMAEKALRVLAVAYREKSEIGKKNDIKNTENSLIFCGFVAMIDPPRPEAYKAIQVCKQAGIKTVMITGDHAVTAKAIAQKLDINSKGIRVMTGKEIDRLSDKEFFEVSDKYDVFARVSPENKVRIVKALKKKGNIVAMTGDGVNDAPALKSADIGCAMGIGGTDVAKGAADMILSDDNFATIVSAVKEGRCIYSNIKKSVHFLLSSNIGEILTILAALLIGFKTPLAPIQLLWINLVTDSLPAIALGLEPPAEDIMEGRKTQNVKGIFTKDMWIRIGLEGIMIGMLSLLSFAIGCVFFDEKGQTLIGSTMAFAVLSISQLIHAFNMKSEKSIFTHSLTDNMFLIGSLLIGIILQAGAIMLEPMAQIFKVTPLSPSQWLIVSVMCLMPIIIVEIEKLVDSKAE